MADLNVVRDDIEFTVHIPWNECLHLNLEMVTRCGLTTALCPTQSHLCPLRRVTTSQHPFVSSSAHLPSLTRHKWTHSLRNRLPDLTRYNSRHPAVCSRSEINIMQGYNYYIASHVRVINWRCTMLGQAVITSTSRRCWDRDSLWWIRKLSQIRNRNW